MDLVIPTGGDPRGVGITEAEKMKEMLIKMGTEKNKIVIEPKVIKQEILEDKLEHSRMIWNIPK